MMNSREKRLIRRALSRPIKSLSSSTNPDRIKSIQSRMMTPNWSHEGQGTNVWLSRDYARTDDGSLVPVDTHVIGKRTVKGSKPPTGFYRGMYR